jgi:hypothetical protein
MPFADSLTFAGVFGCLAVIHAFARCHAVAVNLCSVGGLSLSGNTCEHCCSGKGESGTSGGGFEVHLYILSNRQGCRLEGCSVPTQH